MAGFVEGVGRDQSSLLPATIEDYVGDDNPVRAVDVFVDGLDLRKLGFTSVDPLAMGRPGYHPATMLKLYIYGYLNRIPSSRRLERADSGDGGQRLNEPAIAGAPADGLIGLRGRRARGACRSCLGVRC